MYVVLIKAINFQVSIDGGAETQFQFDGSGTCQELGGLDCPTKYNFTVYNESLPFGSHILDLTLLNATGSYSDGNYTSFQFDYAVVNETDAFPTQATSSAVSTSIPSSAAVHTSTVAPPSPAPSPAQ
jgi:hypothetical protein